MSAAEIVPGTRVRLTGAPSKAGVLLDYSEDGFCRIRIDEYGPMSRWRGEIEPVRPLASYVGDLVRWKRDPDPRTALREVVGWLPNGEGLLVLESTSDDGSLVTAGWNEFEEIEQ